MGKKTSLVKNPHGGLFIVFEGLDGSGQTTQAQKLAGRLMDEFGARMVFLTKEPTDLIHGGAIRTTLKGLYQQDPKTLQLNFITDRSDHLHSEIIPRWLKKGKIVVLDRYQLSTMAYGSLDISLKALMDLFAVLNKDFDIIWPDMTFLLKVSPAECARRMAESREHLELFEEEEKLAKVWNAYERLAKMYPEGMYVLDGEKPIEELAEDIFALVRAHPKLRRVRTMK